MELHSYTRSKQVDFHLSFILCTFLTHLQVDAEIEVAGEKEQNSKEAETEVQNVSTYQMHGFSFSQDHYSFLLFAIISSGLS